MDKPGEKALIFSCSFHDVQPGVSIKFRRPTFRCSGGVIVNMEEERDFSVMNS
jgi:hypothetical protein